MCRRVTCPNCKRPTFAGCGAHVEQVLADVPPDQRCRCNEEKAAAAAPAGESAKPGWLRTLFGR